MLPLLLKSSLGALAVLVIALLSRSQNFFIAGLVPLFPTFALIAHAIVGSERGPEALRTTALFGLWALVPYAIYLAAVYYLAGRLPLAGTLTAATVAWLVAAAVLLVVWMRVQTGG
jgi:membrane protein GlpM